MGYNIIRVQKGCGWLMKEATGELNMTIITVLAIAAIASFIWLFLPSIINSIKINWSNISCPEGQTATIGADGKIICQ